MMFLLDVGICLTILAISCQVDSKHHGDGLINNPGASPRTPSAKPEPEPEPKKIAINCAGKLDGDYANPDQACDNLYFSCFAGVAQIRECSTSNLFFDDKPDLCNIKEEVPACGGVRKILDEPIAVPQEILLFDCFRLKDGNYSVADCESFYYSCVGGKSSVSNCPEELYFDPKSLLCDSNEFILACGGSPRSKSLPADVPPESNLAPKAVNTAKINKPSKPSHKKVTATPLVEEPIIFIPHKKAYVRQHHAIINGTPLVPPRDIFIVAPAPKSQYSNNPKKTVAARRELAKSEPEVEAVEQPITSTPQVPRPKIRIYNPPQAIQSPLVPQLKLAVPQRPLPPVMYKPKPRVPVAKQITRQPIARSKPPPAAEAPEEVVTNLGVPPQPLSLLYKPKPVVARPTLGSIRRPIARSMTSAAAEAPEEKETSIDPIIPTPRASRVTPHQRQPNRPIVKQYGSRSQKFIPLPQSDDAVTAAPADVAPADDEVADDGVGDEAGDEDTAAGNDE